MWLNSQMPSTDNEHAKTVALQALSHILSEKRLCETFLDTVGLSPADLHTRVEDKELLAGVLDFLLSDETALLEFCNATGLAPTDPAHARAHLPGGATPHWT